jgi:5S rRNA maturation endonuclease (ribonuclease M5)
MSSDDSASVRAVAGGVQAPEAVRKWAEKITKRQGCEGLLTHEDSGYHLYIPCPSCLYTHGRREVEVPKYAINLSMVAGLGAVNELRKGSFSPDDMLHNMTLGDRVELGSSVCMRTRSSRKPHRFSLSELMNMGTVTHRHPDIRTRAAIRGSVGSAEREAMWELDAESGVMAPPPPGVTIPIDELPASHPAVMYLTGRGFDIAALREQFRCAFCVKEYDGKEKGIFYRKMPGGWQDTPQHRIVFYSLHGGAPLTWQVRVIEKVSDDGLSRYMLHPYKGGYYSGGAASKQLSDALRGSDLSSVEVSTAEDDKGGRWVHVWDLTHTRPSTVASWQPVPPFDERSDNGSLKFEPAKYRTAKFSSRRMMGWDAAVLRAEKDPSPIKWVILCEGPMDAARAGPGGVALLGATISGQNLADVVAKFDLAILAFDNDKAGREAKEKIQESLMSRDVKVARVLKWVLPMQIPAGKDLGAMTKEEFDSAFGKTMRIFARQT